MFILPEKRFIEANEVSIGGVVSRGRWVLEKRRNGGVVRSASFAARPAFGNHLTNIGLDLLAAQSASAILNACRVGRGTAAPSDSDTAIGSQVATTTTTVASNSISPTMENPVLRYEKTFDFALGAISEPITEIVVGTNAASNYAFSRALITDAAGVPVAFAVEADEQLRATYVLEMLIDTSDKLLTQKLGATTYDVTVRPYRINSNAAWSFVAGNSPMFNASSSEARTGTLVPPDSSASIGNLIGNLSGANNPYIAGSHTRRTVASAGPTTANGSIQLIVHNRAGVAYQAQYSPLIVKTSTQNLTIPTDISWGRAP